MRRPTVYIAGPMRGKPQWNHSAFANAASKFRDMGFTVISPAELDEANGLIPDKMPEDMDWNTVPDGSLEDTFKRDTHAVCECDMLYLLPGWRQSTGATAEFYLARAMHKPIIVDAEELL
jgi:hypothetical protein